MPCLRVPWMLLLLGCASSAEPPPPSLTALWREFQALPPERALAIAGDPRSGHGPWVGGASGGHATRAEAEADAISRCRMQRSLRRLEAECALYAVGDEVVWRGR
jgi:hypothetical protein